MEVAAVELSHHIVDYNAECVVFFGDRDVNLVFRDSAKWPNIVVNVTLVKRDVGNFNGLKHL